jgi:hypothetical protein
MVLVETMRDARVRQLVVLGEPGAGKSTLAILYVAAGVANARRGEPVAVPLAVAAWDPGLDPDVEDWIAQRLRQEYPAIRVGEARWLVQQRKVIAVLDGLDEMPQALREVAFARLEKAAAAGLRMVVTCRSEEYAQTTAAMGVLPQAVVVDIQPVEVGDAAAYLTQREAADSSRWDSVTAALTDQPSGPLAMALSTPLMIALARQVYQRPTSDPGELATLTTPGAVQQRLLSGFLPSVFGSERAAEKAGRWLALLTRHLPDQPRDPDLLWWRLPRAVPRPITVALITAAVTVVCAVLGQLLILSLTVYYGAVHQSWVEIPTPGLAFLGLSAGLGLVLGLIAGLRTARAGHARGSARHRRGSLDAVVSGLWNILTTAATLSALSALLLLAGRLLGLPAATVASILIVDDIRHPSQLPELVWLPVLIGVVALFVNGLRSGRMGTPHRSTPRVRELPSRLLTTVVLVLLSVLPCVALGVVVLGESWDNLADFAVYAGAGGVLLGIGRWLSSPISDEQGGASPAAVLRSDRAALIITVAGLSTIAAGMTAVAGWRIDSSGLLASLVVGCVVAVSVLFGSGSAWLSYTTARFWLALRGKLPWRLMRFLDDAHDRGVLRQAGSAYQIRHALVGAHLAERWTPDAGRVPQPTEDAIGSGLTLIRPDPGIRRFFPVATAVTVILALPAAGFVADPRTRPQATYDNIWTTEERESSSLQLGVDVELTFGPDGQMRVGTVAYGGGLRLWNMAIGRAALGLDPHHDVYSWEGSQVAFSPDGQIFAGTDEEAGVVRLWDSATGRGRIFLQPSRGLPGYEPEHVYRLVFSPRGHAIAVTASGNGSGDGDGGRGRIGVWDVATGRGRFALQDLPDLPDLPDLQYLPATFSPDERILATTDDHGIRLWDVAAQKLIATFRHVHAENATFSPDGRTLAATGGDDDSKVRLWNVATRHTIATISNATHIQFSPTGRIMATVGGDQRLRLGIPTPAVLFHTSTGSMMYTRSPSDPTTAYWPRAMSTTPRCGYGI